MAKTAYINVKVEEESDLLYFDGVCTEVTNTRWFQKIVAL